MSKTTKIHINEPFWSAYKKYGWEHRVAGLGFRKIMIDALCDTDTIINVTVAKEKELYQITPESIRDLARKYSSTFTARANTILYVIPRNQLTLLPDTATDVSS